MFVDQMHEPKAQHIFFTGTDIQEKRFNFVESNEILGEVFFYPIDETEIYIDSLNVSETEQRKGLGTKMIEELKRTFPKLQKIKGFATEEVLEGFWAKQPGYEFVGECSDEYEGYYWFLLKS